MAASGTIVAVGSVVFLLQTGYPHGLIDVYVNSSTQFVGAKPSVGETVTVAGTGSWSTNILATTVTQENVMQASGSVVSMAANEFTLQTGYPHGFIDVYTTSSTTYTGPKPTVGSAVQVSGSGSWSTHILAQTVVRAGSTPSPSPVPSSSPTARPSASPSAGPSFPPNGPSTTTIMKSTPGTFGLMQIFDQFTPNIISAPQAQADGPRYGVTWGARPGMAPSWTAKNASLIATYYMPQETDASPVGWGDAGHTYAWWKTNHPDWILYACDAAGTPTSTPAYIAELPNNVPLDIHNPEVVAYQIQTAAHYAIAENYNGIAFDEVLFENVTGTGVGSGYYGCGIYSNGSFVRRYSGVHDANWEADTIAWVKAAHSILANDSVIGPHHLKMVINHPAGSISDPNEQAILANTDADLDETGFSDYGNYHASFSLFKTTVDWMRYAQAHGTAPLIVDNYSQHTALTPLQTEYSVATYLMGNEGGSGLFTGNSSSYGAEQYLPQYQAQLGAPCGDYYGDSQSPAIFYRSFANALVVVSNGSSASEYAHLRSGHTYVDLMGRPVSNPMLVASGDAYVLLTTNGCQ
ncbi:MAG: hypothetical protein M3R51_09575, partial [Candidatus Eremiobacteraeota bacterium]|nr:hypothetical protein [Candidatus Eremiobacteraeota bacterium]